MKRCGVDCGQLLYGVFHSLGYIPALDLPRDYSLQIAQHQESLEYVELVSRFMREIPEAEALPGDVVVYKLGKAYAHAAIVIEWPSYLIHAVGRHGVSGAHGTKTPLFKHCERKFFTLKDEYCVGASLADQPGTSPPS